MTNKSDPNVFIKESYSIENRMIFIDEVDEETASKLYRAILIMQQISSEPIDVYISSYGGSVYDGFTLFDILTDSDCYINTFAVGKVMSMGLILFMAGDSRYSLKNSTFMFHSASSETEGKYNDMKIDLQEIARLNEKMLDIMSKKSNKSKRFWKSKLNIDFYFDKTTALDYNIVNEE